MKNIANSVAEGALAVLSSASGNFGIKASSEITDNYDRIWARDSAVSALAIISNQLSTGYPAVKRSIELLQKAAAANGQIPSNISVDEQGEINGVSFGGPVGRADSSFWWLIMSIQFLNQQHDEELFAIVHEQANQIFKLADAWEFNGKFLMYLPMSSNWADEYVTHGYVLYDQLLRYWALELAGYFFNRDDWKEKSFAVKMAIKKHFLFEGDLADSLYTKSQQHELSGFNLEDQFIASFTPGDRIEHFDSWSIGLLLLLKIPTAQNSKKLEKAILKVFQETGNNGIPAFYPIINQENQLFAVLHKNHSYNFKNFPGHFHNGGIWPVVNGFMVAGLNRSGFKETASKLQQAMHDKLAVNLNDYPFPEYFDLELAKPRGVKHLCFSASGYLLGSISESNPNFFNTQLFDGTDREDKLKQAIRPKVIQILQQIDLTAKGIMAISIAGESGSGKTTLSRAIKEELELQGKKVLILHQDEYFKLPPHQNHQARQQDFKHIGPEEVRLELLDEHINKIKKQMVQTLSVPRMDWVTDKEESSYIDVRNLNLILVEGTYTSLLKKVDKRIFINTRYFLTRKNRQQRKREDVTDFIEAVLEKESNIISKHSSISDIELDQELNMI